MPGRSANVTTAEYARGTPFRGDRGTVRAHHNHRRAPAGWTPSLLPVTDRATGRGLSDRQARPARPARRPTDHHQERRVEISMSQSTNGIAASHRIPRYRGFAVLAH